MVKIPPDTVLSLVESYYAGAKVYVIITHLKASKMPHCVVMISDFHTQKVNIYYISDLMHKNTGKKCPERGLWVP